MKTILIPLALFAGQYNTLQSKPVVHLPPHQNVIPMEFGGDRIELKNAPPEIRLPPPQLLDAHGHPWVIEVRNLGPGTVTIVGAAQLHAQVPAGQSLTIKATQRGYICGR